VLKWICDEKVGVLSAASTVVRPDNRCIDHLQRGITCAASGKRLKDDVKDAAVGAASKLPKDRIPVAEFLRQVAPRRAGPHLPKNSVKHTPMVARRPATTSDQERFEISPLIVRHQPAITVAPRKEQP
jgi:hypothetical protein